MRIRSSIFVALLTFLFITACASQGETAIIPQTGADEGTPASLPQDLDEVLNRLRDLGVSVEVGSRIRMDPITVPGQTIRINGQDVDVFSFETLEQATQQAERIKDLNTPMEEPSFYQAGTMIIHYAGTDSLIRDLLKDVLEAHAAGQ